MREKGSKTTPAENSQAQIAEACDYGSDCQTMHVGRSSGVYGSCSMNLKVWLTFCVLFGCLLSRPLTAGPIDEGQIAFERGDYVTALRYWRQLTEQGNAIAQYRLGLMYAEGRGVPQDDSEA